LCVAAASESEQPCAAPVCWSRRGRLRRGRAREEAAARLGGAGAGGRAAAAEAASACKLTAAADNRCKTRQWPPH